MIKFTCQTPGTRSNNIRNGLDILNYQNNEHLRQFGIRVSNEMAVVGLIYMIIASCDHGDKLYLILSITRELNLSGKR